MENQKSPVKNNGQSNGNANSPKQVARVPMMSAAKQTSYQSPYNTRSSTKK